MKSRLRSVLSMFLVLFGALAVARELPIGLSLVRLLADPQAFDNKEIIVSGYLCMTGPDQFGLFLGRSDCNDYHFGNAVEVDMSRIPEKRPKRPELVTVEGTFRSRADLIHVDVSYQFGIIEPEIVSRKSPRN